MTVFFLSDGQLRGQHIRRAERLGGDTTPGGALRSGPGSRPCSGPTSRISSRGHAPLAAQSEGVSPDPAPYAGRRFAYIDEANGIVLELVQC